MMFAPIYDSFEHVIREAGWHLQHSSELVHSARWQGADITDKPEMATHELRHVSFLVNMPTMDLSVYQEQIKPNLPWADDHFEERVCGQPINPGTEWKNWPYGKSAERFLDERGQFNHNYMERYYPKYAQMPKAGPPTHTGEEWRQWMITQDPKGQLSPHYGIRYPYGDLDDVVNLLVEDPYTRQAYLPVWFPEDTGGGSKRAPCTIGYHFLIRDGRLDVTYQIRSCDYVRHFRDDIYLTIRLVRWVIWELRRHDPKMFDELRPGAFIMSIQSLHIFRNDYYALFGKKTD